jgi:hypothetical protein
VGKIIKWSVVFLFIFSLTACQFSHTPQITHYEPEDSEADILHAVGIQQSFLYNYHLGNKKRPTKLQFWIELYDKGQKVDEIQRTFDFKGMGNKGKMAIFVSETTDKQVQTYHMAIGERFEASSMDTLKDIGTLGENLSGSSVSGFNTKADIKYNQPIILAVQVFSLKKEMGPLDNQIYTNQCVG